MTQNTGGNKDEGQGLHAENLSPDAQTKASVAAPVHHKTSNHSCALTGETDNLGHFIADPQGQIIFDLYEKIKMPHGFYLSLDPDTLSKAYDQGMFDNKQTKRPSFETKQALLDFVRERLEQDFYQMVSLLRRSGDMVHGAVKVETLMRNDDQAKALIASDIKKMPSYFDGLDAHRLLHFGQAERFGPYFNKERVVFIGLKRHHLVPILKKRIEILRRF